MKMKADASFPRKRESSIFRRLYAYWPAMLLVLGLLLAAGPLQAATAYDVTGVTFSQTVTAQQFVRVTQDLNVSWTAPTGVVPDPMNYYLKFSESNAAWTGLDPSNAATYDFVVQHPAGFQTIPKSFFDAYDSDKVRYLHIITQYLNTQTASVAYSDDVVSAAIRIDNVAPTGTLTLDPTSGTTKQINVSMTPSEPIKWFWLNDASSWPGGAGTDYTLFQQGTVNLRDGTAYGTVKIYGWFEDYAGNRTTAASASADYTYQAPVAIQYNSATVNVDATLAFTVDGAAKYDWTITDASVEGVVEFSGASTDVASATVTGKKAGTFTITAVPKAGGSTLKTATITVVQTTTSKDYNLITTTTTSVNAIVLSRIGTGYTKASHLFAAVPNCDGLSRWSANFQAYDGYDNIFGTNDFDLVVGEPYFVSVSAAGKFTVTGSVPAPSYALKTTTTTNVNAISLPQSKSGLTKASQLFANIPSIDGLSRWSANFQAYDGYDNIFGTNDFAIAVDEAYFVSVSSQATWP
jgi:hypothetical protein